MSEISQYDAPKMDVYGGVRWSAATKYTTQAVEIGIAIVLARILDPGDYGLFGMALVFSGFLQIFRTFGFGQAIIRWKTITDDLLASVFWVNVGIACLLALVLMLSAPLISWIYADPRVAPIICVLSVTYLLSAPGIVPDALLNRRMAFDQLAAREILTAIIKGASAILMAICGWGVWALVGATIVASATQTVLVWILSGWRLRFVFKPSEVRKVMGFGANLTGFSVFNYFARSADNFIIAAFLGATPLGYYSLAYRILLFPRDTISQVIGRVILPAFSRMQDNDAQLASAYLRLCSVIAFLTFPMMTGFALVASPFVEVVLGRKWLPALPILWLFAPLGMLQSISTTAGHLYLAKGRADWMFRWSVAASCCWVTSFLAGLPWGVVGVAASYTVMNVVLLIPGFSIPFRLVRGLTLSALWACLWPSIWTTAIMGLAVGVSRAVFAWAGVSQMLALAVSICVGVIVYTSVALAGRHSALKDCLRLLPMRWSAFLNQSATGVPARNGE